MTGPNDFTISLQELIGSLIDRVRHGVEQPASLSFIFQPNVTSYALPASAFSVTRVTGFVSKNFTVFEPGQYRFSLNQLIWVDQTDRPNIRPDANTRFEVEYTYRDLPSGLTDFNPGSVVGTLLRAVAREMTLLYDQMDQAYRRAFIEQANGVALDNVVALLGVLRKPAQKAKGRVTFFRKRAATQTVLVPVKTKVADQSGRVFVTTEEGRIPLVEDELVGDTRKVKNLVAELVGVWPKGDNPESAPRLAAVVDRDERTINPPPAPAPPLPAGELLVRYKPKSVTVSIEALDSGPDGNVNAGTITIMPTPPPNIDGVTNEEQTDGGLIAEPDDRLRERARHALERAGNATLNAIKFAVLGVEGVQGTEVLDHQADDSIPLGEVHVRCSGGDPSKLQEVVERTRAAGVMVKWDPIFDVTVSGTFYLLPGLQVPANAPDDFIKAVIAAMQALTIGAPLVIRRLNSLVFNFPGLADVAEAQLRFSKPDPARPGSFLVGDIGDPFLISQTELVRPDKAHLKAVVLVALHAPAHRKGVAGSGIEHVIDIQITDTTGAVVSFRDFSIDLHVTLRAGLLAAPNQPAERIGSFTHPVRFTSSSTAALNILTDDMKGFHEVHKPVVEFEITAAAYPGLQGDKTPFDVRA